MRTTFANSKLEGTTILPHNYTLYSNTYVPHCLSSPVCCESLQVRVSTVRRTAFRQATRTRTL